NLIVHLLLFSIQFTGNNSLDRLFDIREAFQHGSTHTYTFNQVSKLLLLMGIDSHNFTEAANIFLIAISLTELPIGTVNLRIQEVKQRPQLSGVIHETSTSHNVLELSTQLLDIPSPLSIVVLHTMGLINDNHIPFSV